MNDLSKATSQFTAARAPRVSVVLPLHNAGRAIADRIAEVVVDAELAHINLTEIIAVDDGSSDRTWAALQAEARHEPLLRPIRLRRHFGKAAAREAGVLAAVGDIVITLEPDAPAADLGQLEGLVEAGHDVVIGWRGGKPVKPSRIARSLTGLNLRNPFGATAAYRREVLAALSEGATPLASLPFTAQRMGYRVGEMEIAAPVRHDVRQGLMDVAALCSAAVRFHASERWLGLAMLAGAALTFAAVALPAIALLLALAFGLELSPLPLVITGLALLLCGIQITGLAMLGSMSGRGKAGGSRANGQIAETLLRHGAPD